MQETFFQQWYSGYDGRRIRALINKFYTRQCDKIQLSNIFWINDAQNI
jgi:hypothetical protein